MASINGTANADGLAGTSGADVIDGGDGNDTLYGLAGDDHLLGGLGDDTLTGDDGSDVLEGQDGADQISDSALGNDQLFGGDGNDILTVRREGFQASQSTISADGGAGDDNLYVLGRYAYPSSGIQPQHVDATLLGGAGNDAFTVIGNVDAVIDGGVGDDRVVLWQPASARVTLGEGADVIQLISDFGGLTTVTDFAAGAGGDRVEFLDSLLPNYLKGWNGDNPFATGHLRLVQDGADAVLQIDRDAAGAADGWVSIIRFENTDAAQFAAENFTGYAPDGAPTPGITIVGTEAADTLSGTRGGDLIQGLGGADYVTADAGDDVVEGGAGDDIVYGADGDDRLDGGDGNDLLSGGNGANVLTGGAGDDILEVGGGADAAGDQVLDGGDGNDALNLYFADAPRAATVTGGDGNDVLSVVGSGLVTFDGGAGDDLVKLTNAGGVTLTLGAGADTVRFLVPNNDSSAPQRVVITDFAAGEGGDRLDLLALLDAQLTAWDHDTNPFAAGYARLIEVDGAAVLQINPSGDQWLDLAVFQGVQPGQLTAGNLGGYPADGGTPAGAVLTGGGVGDTLTGGLGPDQISGAGGADVLDGGRGDDRLDGGTGNDQLQGGSGSDVLLGGDGNDRLQDSAGLRDQLYGGAGDDNLFVMRGSDTSSASIVLDGGAGHDQITYSGTFAWSTPLQGTVSVFGGRGMDRIDVSFASQTYIDAGADDDVVTVGASAGQARITLGAGADTLQLGDLFQGDRAASIVVTDFNVAEDKIAVSGAFRFVTAGANTLLQVNADGVGDDWVSVVRFENVLASNIAASNLTYGTPGPAWIVGTTGADRLTVSGPYTHVDGGAGDDIVQGGSQNDGLNGGGGADTLSGAGGDDLLAGGAGDDVYDGGAGFDTADFSKAAAGVVVDLSRADGQDTGEGVDRFTGIEAVIGSAFNDRLTGSAGDDVLEGGSGANVLTGGAGNDVFRLAGGVDTVDGGAGFDWIDFSSDRWGVKINLGQTTEQMTWLGFLTVSGVEAVRGGSGDDRLTGSAGADTLEGGQGQDLLAGGAGDDTFVFGKGDGQDTISDFVAGGAQDRIRITGYSAYQELRQQGADTLVVLSGGDSILLKNVTAASLTAADFVFVPGPPAPPPMTPVEVTASMAIAQGQTVNFTFDGVASHAYAYILTPPSSMTPIALTNNGTLSLVSADPATQVGLIAGQYGWHGSSVTNNGTLSVTSAGGGVAFDLFQGDYDFFNAGTVSVTAATTAMAYVTWTSDLLVNNSGTIEVSGADSHGVFMHNGGVVRNSGSLHVVGGVHGAAVGVQFDSNADLENSGTIIADDRDPTTVHSVGVQFRDYGTVRIVNLSGGVITGDYAVREITDPSARPETGAAYVENRGTMNGMVDLGGGADTLVNSGVVNGTVDLGAGNDLYDGSGAVHGTVFGREGADTLQGGAGVDVFDGGEDGDLLVGRGGADVLAGGAGDDVLDGGDGADQLDGGDGVDTASYAGAAAAVTVNLAKSGAQITGGAGSDTLVGIENLTGSGFADSLRGDAGANVLIGGAGNDVIEGGGGADRLDGGAGVDTATYINTTGGLGVTVDLRQSGQQNTGGAGVDLLIGFENLTGSRYDDRLTGDGGDNRISGAGGADVLAGGAGADLLDGGTGVDTADYSSATGGITINLNAMGQAADTGGAGVDTLKSVENLVGSAFNDSLRGHAGTNVIEGGDGDDVIEGGGGHDRLFGGAGIDTASYANSTAAVTVRLAKADAQVTGGAGSDTLNGFENLTGSRYADRLTGDEGNNVLTGLGGDDLLDGGAGNDVLDGGGNVDTATYAGATSGVTVNLTLSGPQDTGGAGIDTLISIENVTGSAFNDSLRGNTGGNVLIGGAGDDVLEGGGGEDRLDGGTGNDTASYAHSAAAVTINLNAGGTQATGGAGTDTLISIENVTGSAFADTLRGNAVANVLDGGSGNDVLIGGGGNDTVIGGAGNDLMTGGTGDDLFVFGAGFGQDRIDDFVAGGTEDRLDFSAFAGTGVTWTLTQVDEDAVFSFSDGSTLTLAHVQASGLTQAGDWGWG